VSRSLDAEGDAMYSGQRMTISGKVKSKPPFVLVIRHESATDGDESAEVLLRQLGAEVRTLDFWQDASTVSNAIEDASARAIVIEAGDRPDHAVAALRAVRRQPHLEATPAIISVPARQVTSVELSSGFDDFIVTPFTPTELYARIRLLEWKRSEFSTEERLKIGPVVIDRAAHEVHVDGRSVSLTAKEFALLCFLATNRGRVFTRDALLARVWGARYDGGARTVDIHVRRLRAKLGEDTLPLETLRGAGYKLRAPTDKADEELLDGESTSTSKARVKSTTQDRAVAPPNRAR
jgi:DNA-binding response OmpR family regulator